MKLVIKEKLPPPLKDIFVAEIYTAMVGGWGVLETAYLTFKEPSKERYIPFLTELKKSGDCDKQFKENIRWPLEPFSNKFNCYVDMQIYWYNEKGDKFNVDLVK